MAQIVAQKQDEAYLIVGVLDVVGQNAESHGFNIIFQNGLPYLVDTQIPMAKDSNGKITHPYIAPLLDIESEYFDFVVPKEFKQGRTYSIR